MDGVLPMAGSCLIIMDYVWKHCHSNNGLLTKAILVIYDTTKVISKWV